MQKYECVFILRADLPEAELAVRVDRIGDLVAEHGGEVTTRDHWGVRRFEYEIDHLNKGDYMLMRFRCQPAGVAAIDRYLRLDDKVVRHLVVRDEEWEERNRVAMAKRRHQVRVDDDIADNQD
jgi:small subunit ribosomal protein S6